MVYFAGEWVNSRAVSKLAPWVKKGGILYAAAGCGHLNQFNEKESAMRKLLGLKSTSLKKNAYLVRTFLELPLLKPIDTITLGGKKLGVVAMRQKLVPGKARVLGVWRDGSAAVTVHKYGKGQAFAVGTLPGNSYFKTALKVQPWARGGRRQVYNPVKFAPAAVKLVRLGVEAATGLRRQAECSNPYVEALLIDNAKGTCVTLVNWTNSPIQDLKVTVRTAFKPRTVRSVSQQKRLKSEYTRGKVTFVTDLTAADYILLLK